MGEMREGHGVMQDQGAPPFGAVVLFLVTVFAYILCLGQVLSEALLLITLFLRPKAAIFPGSLLGMQNRRLQPTPSESESSFSQDPQG